MAAPSCYIGSMKDKKLSPELDKVELHPDGWERFERDVKTAFRAPPIHRPAKPKGAPKAKANRRGKS